MYKISWARKSDKFHRVFVIAPDVHALFEINFVLAGCGGGGGCTPVDIVVTNLDGDVVDMSKGLADAAACGTYSSR